MTIHVDLGALDADSAIIATLRLSPSAELRVVARRCGDRRRYDVREWFRARDGRWIIERLGP